MLPEPTHLIVSISHLITQFPIFFSSSSYTTLDNFLHHFAALAKKVDHLTIINCPYLFGDAFARVFPLFPNLKYLAIDGPPPLPLKLDYPAFHNLRSLTLSKETVSGGMILRAYTIVSFPFQSQLHSLDLYMEKWTQDIQLFINFFGDHLQNLILRCDTPLVDAQPPLSIILNPFPRLTRLHAHGEENLLFFLVNSLVASPLEELELGIRSGQKHKLFIPSTLFTPFISTLRSLTIKDHSPTDVEYSGIVDAGRAFYIANLNVYFLVERGDGRLKQICFGDGF